MSASKQKRVRTEQRTDGVVDKKAAAANEKAVKDRKFRRNTIITVVVIVIVVALALLINSSLFYTGIDAVVIDGTGYTAAEVSYYYNTAINSYYNQMYSTLGSYMSLLGVDFSQPMDEQAYMSDDYETWADYFYDSALTQMANETAIYAEAMSKGHTLSADKQTEIDTYIDGLVATAESNGYSADGYAALVFGKGVDIDLVRELLTKQYIVSSYCESVYNSFTYTADELSAYYAEHADELDMFEYHSYTVSTSDEAYSELEDDEAKTAAAREDADKIAEAASVEEFLNAVSEYVGKDEALEYSDGSKTRAITQGQSLSTDIQEWMLSADRKTGDTMVYDSTSGSTVVMFVSRSDNQYNTVDFRHILVSAVADENGEYTEEALAEAKASIEDIYAMWQEDPTEELFIELANSYSEDSDGTDGGLYENVYHDYMVDEINDFIFDENTQPGDTIICHGESSYYNGYHIVYFVGENQMFCDYLAENSMRSEDYNAYYEALTENVQVTEKFGSKFIEF